MEKLSDKLFNWASILEDNTLQQAVTASTMPFIYPHIALMPDAHLGKGATVGSVIPTVGAIIPAAVGVDIGCVDADTEYLSPTGWRRIADYDGGLVMQYHLGNRNTDFVSPQRYIVRNQATFLRFKTKYGVDQALTSDHKILCWRPTGRDRKYLPEIVTAEEFANRHTQLVQGNKAVFETTFTPTLSTSLLLTDEELRVQIMVMADAHLTNSGAYLKLRKPHKIERANKLLSAAGIVYTKRSYKDDTTAFTFVPPIMTKTYDWCWQASLHQLQLIAEECLHWDGNLRDRVFFTRDKASADFIQYAFTASGWRSVLRFDIHQRDGRKDYRVFAHGNTKVSMAGTPRKSPIGVITSTDGKAYCFTVPSGFLVLRRNGNVFITGNCGMIAVKTQFSKDSLGGKDLSALRKAIEHAIPSSAGKYNQKLTDSAETRIHELETEIPNHHEHQPLDNNWRYQLGSLGSGNHFIEVSIDEDSMVWLFLHSGSRGVGNRLAMMHIKVAQKFAKKYFIQLPDPDLAYLADHTEEFGRYIQDLNWAQKFALLNREEMMDRVITCFEEFIDEDVIEQEQINCHHNFTQKEHHFNKDVWLTRKGAIQADEGRPGLIPGSMGTASYVVAGRGNKLSLNSSPHGAGRNYSRSAARKTFTIEQLREAMKGIEYRDTDAFLDEIPQAYKDIDVVMRDAADLVEIKHTLHQIVNVKGD